MFHAERGDCVARAVPQSSDLVLGQPDVEWLRANQPAAVEQEEVVHNLREKNIDDALNNLHFSATRCTACGYPVPSWWEACRVCGSVEVRPAKPKVP